MRMNQFATDENKVKRLLLVIFLIATSVFLARFGLVKKMPVIGLLIPLVGVASWLLGRPALLFALVLAVERSGISIPGMPKAIGFAKLFQLLLFGWMLLDVMVRHNRPRFSFRKGIDGWLVVFFLNLLFIMAMRGSGFALLGGSVYGGTYYIGVFITILCYFAAIRARLSDKDVKILLFMFLFATMLPAGVQVLKSLVPSAAGGLARYIGVSAVEQSDSISTDNVIQRWSGFISLSQALVMIAYVFFKKISTRLLLIVLACGLVSMSGFRSSLIQTAMLIFFVSVYYSKQRGRAVFRWIIAGVLGWVFLMMITPSLPLPTQRSLSFIPFLPVSAEVAVNAESSSDFRFEIWKQYCIPNVPKYLLIGRGLAHDITQYAWLTSRWYGSLEFYYYMGSYHSGLFSLLLDYGLLGLVSFTLFFLLVAGDAWRTTRRYAAHQDTLCARYYVYLTILMTYEIFNYFFIFGAVLSSLFRMLMIAAQLRILKKNFLLESLPAAGMPEVRSQRSGFRRQVSGGSPATQQLTTNSARPVNRWARPGAARR